MERAREFLKGGARVSAVCLAVGFDSLTTFSSWFRKMTGYSPFYYVQHQEELKDQLRGQPLCFIPGCFAESRGWKKSNFEEAEE